MEVITKKKTVVLIISIIFSFVITILLIFVFILNQAGPLYYYAKGNDYGITNAEDNNRYLSLNMMNQINSDYSLTLNNVFLGTKRIIITYTLTSENKAAFINLNSDDISNRCIITIDGKKYNIIGDTMERPVNNDGAFISALILDECNYGENFALYENTIINVSFSNLLNTDQTIDFEFQIGNPDFIINQLNFAFKHNMKKYIIHSVELDSTTTTLNFNRSVEFRDMIIVQGNNAQRLFKVSNRGQYYICFPAVERGIPFTVYLNNESDIEIITHVFH
jgi:hypothetical protein